MNHPASPDKNQASIRENRIEAVTEPETQMEPTMKMEPEINVEPEITTEPQTKVRPETKIKAEAKIKQVTKPEPQTKVRPETKIEEETKTEAQITASVMEIERFAIHDGPGIRTVVFLQGCPLRCLWCANPESQSIGKKLMHYKSKCIGCGSCSKVCLNGAIGYEDNHPVFFRDKCKGCGLCEESCLKDAIHFSGKRMTVEAIMSTVERDRDYYENSGGGITLSGGEAFVQFTAFMELLKQSKAAGIHTAVETCGQVSSEKIKMAEPLVDCFLFDIKHMDRERFVRYTGGDLPQIFENLDYLAGVNPEKIIIRVPVIPGFNSDRETLSGILEKAGRLRIPTVHLLPYHTLGISKYEQMGKEYEFPCSTSMAKEELTEYIALGQTMGLRVQIGG